MCDQAIYSPIATRNISSRSYGHCNQAGASHGSQLESEFLECSKDTDLPPTERGKKNKICNYSRQRTWTQCECFWNDGCEHLFLHCSSGFPRLGGRESSASLQFWLSTDWSIINKDWNSNGQDWEIRMNTHNSTGLRIPTDWISCAKPSSARPSHTLYPCPLLPLLLYVPHFLATISVVLILRLQLLWV